MPACEDGFGDCDKDVADGCETQLASDAQNCGACELTCGDASCTDGICEPEELISFSETLGDIVVDRASIYVSTQGSGAPTIRGIQRIPKDGGDASVLVEQLNFPTTLVLAGPDLFWTDRLATNDQPSVGKVPIGGGAFEVIKSSEGQPSAHGLVVHSGIVFWSETKPESILSVSVDGGMVSTLANVKAFTLAASEDYVYWTSLDAVGRVLKVGAELEVLATSTTLANTVLAVDDEIRMRAPAQFAAGAEFAAGLAPGSVLAAYQAARHEADQVGSDDPVTAALLGWARHITEWEGTASELLKAVTNHMTGDSDSRTRLPKHWPAHPRGMRAALDRGAAVLERYGVQVGRGSRGRGSSRRDTIIIQGGVADLLEVGDNPAPTEKRSSSGGVGDVADVGGAESFSNGSLPSEPAAAAEADGSRSATPATRATSVESFGVDRCPSSADEPGDDDHDPQHADAPDSFDDDYPWEDELAWMNEI